MLLGVWLRAEGYLVVEAENASEAEACVVESASPFDLVLSDICMPDQDGVSLMGQLSQHANVTEFLLMSSIAKDLHEAQGRDIPTPRFLQKPFSRQQLVDRILAVLE